MPNDERTELNRLIEEAKKTPMTPEERTEQVKNFAFGNGNIDDARISKATLEEAAVEISAKQAMA